MRSHGHTLIAASSAMAAMTALILSGSASATARPTRADFRTTAADRVGRGGVTAVITRDSYGVPSIRSRTLDGMWFGAGWAQAQDRMAQLELTRRAVEGTLSQIFGSGELGQDETVRTFFYTPAELRAQFRSLPAATQQAITEFSAGINAYENHVFTAAQQFIPVEFVVLGQAL